MIVFDTTILVHAVGADHPLRATSRRLVAAVGEGNLAATTTVEVIQEFAHVRARRRGRADARRLAASYADLLAPLASPDADDLDRGLQLFARNEHLGAFDAVITALVLRHDHLTALISAERAFAGVEGLTFIDPADKFAVDSMIGRRP